MDGSVPILVPDEADMNVLEEKGTSGAASTMTRCTSVKFRVNRVSGDGCKTLVGGRGLGVVVWCGVVWCGVGA